MLVYRKDKASTLTNDSWCECANCLCLWLVIPTYDEKLQPDHVRPRLSFLGRHRSSWVDDGEENSYSRECGGGGGCSCHECGGERKHKRSYENPDAGHSETGSG